MYSKPDIPVNAVLYINNIQLKKWYTLNKKLYESKPSQLFKNKNNFVAADIWVIIGFHIKS